MKMYKFDQNNTGGSFRYNINNGTDVIVFAKDSDHANSIVEDLSEGFVYFDGVEKEEDCGCCGDRWLRCSEYDEVSQFEDSDLILNKEYKDE